MNALGFVLLFLILIIGLGIGLRRFPSAYRPRRIPAFKTLVEQAMLAVEEGRQVHISLGRGGLVDPTSPAALVGLSMVERIATLAAASDRPPVVSTGDGALTLLAQDAQRAVYREIGMEEHYNPWRSRLTGLTPFSYAAGIEPLARDERVALHVLTGHTVAEAAVITDAIERQDVVSVAGSDSLPAQAVFYATARQPLIGEELYAGGAYLGAGPWHLASLWSEDILRLLLILGMVIGAVLKLVGVL